MRMWLVSSLSVAAVATICAPAWAYDDAQRAEVKRLTAGTSATDHEAAVKLLEAELVKTPDDFELQLETVTTMNGWISLRTNANLPLPEGLLDTDANKAIWGRDGKRALAIAEKLFKTNPKDGRVAVEYAVAYMYVSSSLGILKAITSGAASKFKENAQRVIDLNPDFDDALGYFMYGSFYMVAPWPVSDDDKARDFLQAAMQSAPKSVRNHYGLGVFHYREDEWPEAKRMFQAVLDLPCNSPRERFTCAFMKSEAKKALAHVASK